jgi:hypothetical protein
MLDGLRDAVTSLVSQAVAGNAREREETLRSLASSLDRLPQPTLIGDADARARHAAQFRARLQ